MATLTKVKPTAPPSVVAEKTKVGRDQEIGSLWKRTSQQTNEEYFTGELSVEGGKVNVIVFKNGFKKDGSKEPDYRIYLRPDKQ